MSDEVEAAEDSERTLSAASAAELIDAGAELIDVRRPIEFEAGHLPGARNVEMNDLTVHSDEIPGDRPVLFYCRSGNRSGMAADAFREAGWDSHSLDGGIEAWVADGRPLDPADGEVRAPPPPSADAA